MKYFLSFVMAFSVLFQSEATYHKNEPLGFMWGNPQGHEWNEAQHVWVNHNIRNEGWVRAGLANQDWRAETEEVVSNSEKPIPVRTTYRIVLRRNVFRKTENIQASALLAAGTQMQRQKKRLVLINLEQTANYDPQYRIWPHLGILYVGTVAYEEGWEVVLWDELIQSHAKLEELVEPGDIVGLSMVVTGIERGVEVARQAKRLGARYVIAGNDSAIFRAEQLLRIPDQPIDAVFTSNSTNAVREFLSLVGTVPVDQMQISEVAVNSKAVVLHSNEHAVMQREFRERKLQSASGLIDVTDGFVVPKLDLFPSEYWNKVWRFYRDEYGHKHADPENVRNALALFAQGCTRTQGVDACSYCSIFGIGDVRIPNEEHLTKILDAYKTFGIDSMFNVTDSSFEMRPLLKRLQNIGAEFGSLLLYSRAQGIANHPELIEEWMKLGSEWVRFNVGMDSGDERILSNGVIKSSVVSRGSRLEENRQAVRNIRDSGAHLHFSLIFGSPGETSDSCERSLEFLQWAADTLGPQLDLVETDIYWLNFGATAARVFHDYEYAGSLAALAGKVISVEEWQRDFAQHSETLVTPWSAEQAWYRHFTGIDTDLAYEFNARAKEIMDRHPGSIKGRAFKPGQEV